MIFTGFPKIPRLNRECTITEKVDGTNASIVITENDTEPDSVVATVDGLTIRAGSRKRFITPDDDNFGFAAWVHDNALQLRGLGPGRHYGEWWGSGIQRGYGLTKGEKRFSLFNTSRWSDDRHEVNVARGEDSRGRKMAPDCCYVVPTLYQGIFSTVAANGVIDDLRLLGSAVAPGFKHPEGVIVYHAAANVYFKATLEADAIPKALT